MSIKCLATEIGDEGVKTIAVALEKNNALTNINLSSKNRSNMSVYATNE